MDHNKLWKIFKEMEIPDHLTCLLRNLYADQEATVRTRHRTMDWFKTGKGVHQGCILSPAYSISIQSISCEMPRWDELQAGIKIGGRNINNLRYTDDTTLMVESQEELNSFLIRVKEENERTSLKLSIKNLRPWHLAPLLHGK